ncbi:MAG: M14 family metallopeptidase [Cyclobacteriaceae bacterium]|nr:M14 family metallopeptidase [Cyclobacteriaceae bacterium]
MKSSLSFTHFFSIALFLFISSICSGQNNDPMNPKWDKYHSTAETNTLLEGWAKAFPNLTKLYSIGETLKGTPLMVLEISNKNTGASATKPAYYYDGNIHAGELTGAEVALHYAWHLLSNYNKNERIKQLVDTRVVYIRPKFNPDGADLALLTPTVLRSTPRPYDEDFDGLIDEDPSNDLDGNGIITKMRVKNTNGKFKISDKDSRIMEPREIGEMGGTYYDIYTEGTDDDKDGTYNEDGVGGIDMNRNFPRNWGLEFEQKGAGPYPLSEPETRATIEFINAKKHITGVFHGHTSGGFLFRLPSTTNWDNYNMADQKLIIELSSMYTTTTGQRVIPSYSNPRLHRHGTLISWSYWDFGVVAYVPEFWGGFVEDYDGDGNITEHDKLTWNDKNIKGEGFINWKTYEHPDLGTVEIGGWNRKFTFQNPPVKYLKSEIEKYVEWMLWLAETSPLLTINTTEVTTVEKNKVVILAAEIQNSGYLPTNITQRAIEANLNQPVRAVLELKNAALISGKLSTDLGHIVGSRDSDDASSDSKRNVTYGIRIDGSNATATLTIYSDKGGVVSEVIKLN